MQIGIFAKTFAAQGAVPVLTAARNAGYETVQFNMACMGLSSMPDEIPVQMASEIARASKRTGVSIAAVSATYNMIHPDITQRELGMRRLETMMQAANTIGTGLVTLCTGTRDTEDQWRHHPDNQSREAWADLLTEMEMAVKLAEAYSVDLGIEPELANVVNNADAAQRLIRDNGSPRIRIVLDPANLFEVAGAKERHDIVAHAVDLLGDRISMAHAKDRNAAGQFVAAGTGVIDFVHFVSCLQSAGFDGPLVTHGLAENQASEVAAVLREIVAR
ncbi:MAG: sugar phosphate isomerase/epimerase family protein [Rhizobiaceae bacterium]